MDNLSWNDRKAIAIAEYELSLSECICLGNDYDGWAELISNRKTLWLYLNRDEIDEIYNRVNNEITLARVS